MLGILHNNVKCHYFYAYIVIIAIAVICFGSCGYSSSSQSDIETLSVEIDPQKVAKIDLYWNYRTYTVLYEDNDSLIQNTVGLINGIYSAGGRWLNDRTGSGDHITFYDMNGNPIAEYYFIRRDGVEGIEQGIWSEEITEKILFQKNGSQKDTKELIENIVEGIKNK